MELYVKAKSVKSACTFKPENGKMTVIIAKKCKRVQQNCNNSVAFSRGPELRVRFECRKGYLRARRAQCVISLLLSVARFTSTSHY